MSGWCLEGIEVDIPVSIVNHFQYTLELKMIPNNIASHSITQNKQASLVHVLKLLG